MVCHFLIKPLIWAHSGRCWQHFIPTLPFFLSGIPPASRLAPVSALVSGAAPAAAWSPRWPWVTLCRESRGTGSSGTLGLAAFPRYGVRGTGRSAWWIYLVSGTGNVILQLKHLWLPVWKAPHLELQPQEMQQNPENSETADFRALETVIS